MRMDGPPPFPTGDRGAVPFVVSPQGVAVRADGLTAPSHMGAFAGEAVPEGMTGDKELLERMGVSSELADALVTEATGGPPVIPVAGGTHEPAPGFTVADTDPEIIARIDAQARETTLEEIVRANGSAGDDVPLLERLAPPPEWGPAT